MRARLRTSLSVATVAALAVAGLALGAAPASAATMSDECYSTTEAAVTLTTATGVWYQVCLADGSTSDAHTQHKTDAFDGFGFLYLNYDTADEVALVADAPALVEELPGDEVRISFSDLDVQWAVGDLVDVYVVKTIKGSTQRWSFTILDSDDNTPRNDVEIDIIGNLGSDSSTDWQFNTLALITYGDPNDPIVIMQPFGPGGNISGIDPSDPENVYFVAVGSGSGLNVGVVDYSCEAYEDAIDYAYGIAPIIGTMYGQTLVEPGSSPCLTAVSPIYLTTGAAFDVPLQVTFGDEFDFSQGGDLSNWYDNVSDWASFEVEGQSEAGVVPSLSMYGTAPTAPGTYFVYARGESYVNGIADQVLILVIVEAPKLAATGSEMSPIVVGGAIGFLIIGAAALVFVRRRSAQH